MKLPPNRLVDRYGRYLNYLRISITDRCNLRCIYCNPAEAAPKLLHREILRYEEILRLVRIGVRLGITKVRVTGGEPLVRKGACDFLKKLCRIEGLKDISLTTNGVMLAESIDDIAEAGIRRINISLDTLDSKTYHRITGRDLFDTVWEGITSAHQKGFSPIKLNVVVLNKINDHELVDLARLSLNYPFHIRFIEYMPIGRALASKADPLFYDQIRSRIQQIGELIPVQNEALDGPAGRFRFKNAPGEIGFISAVSHHFCDTCNRLRLTADGRIRPCLLSGISEDIKTPLRAGLLDEDLAKIFMKAAQRKPHRHPKAIGAATRADKMVSIGG